MRSSAEELNRHPRDQRLYRALYRTFLNPAATQERAADLLGLPFSTYRAHLRAGTQRVTELLWRQELYGAKLQPSPIRAQPDSYRTLFGLGSGQVEFLPSIKYGVGRSADRVPEEGSME